MNKSLTKNYILIVIKNMCSIMFPLITFVYASRILGAEGIGKVNFSKAFITFFMMIATLGINQYGTREAAKLRDNRNELTKFAHEVIAINIVSTFFSFILLLFTMKFVHKLDEYSIFLMINSISIFMQGLGLEWLYQAEEEYGYITKRAILFQIVALVALFCFVHSPDDLEIYTWINVLSTSGSYILNFLYSKRFIDWKYIGGYEVKKHLVGMLWLFAMAVSIELYTVLDSTMLGLISGNKAVGLYTAAIRVNKLTNSLITALGVILIPRVSYYIGRNEKDKLNELICKGYNYVFLMSIPAAIGLFCLSENIVLVLSGSEYGEAAITMRILTPIVILIPFSMMTNNQTFVPMKLEKLILLSTFVGAIVNFVANSILIPKFAQNGAAIGTVIAEAAVGGVCLFNVVKLLDTRAIFKVYYQYWIASIPILLISYIVKLAIQNYILQMFIIIFFSGIWYAVCMFGLKNEYYMSMVVKLINIIGYSYRNIQKNGVE